MSVDIGYLTELNRRSTEALMNAVAERDRLAAELEAVRTELMVAQHYLRKRERLAESLIEDLDTEQALLLEAADILGPGYDAAAAQTMRIKILVALGQEVEA